MSIFTRTAKRLFSSSAVIDSSSQGTIGPPSGTVTERERLLRRRQNLRNPILRFLYAALYGFDLALLYLIKARLLLLSGNVVICDRYTADSRIDFAISSGKRIDQSPLALTLLEVLAPKPDLSFILDVEETEALRRKPEEGDTGHLAESREMFLSIAERRRMILMPPDASWEILHEKITLESLSRYYRGYRTLLNALFLINPNQLNPGRWRE
jgi:thymidylate kinase